jgi:hypothetical protein
MENRSLALLSLVIIPFLVLHLATFSQFGVQWDEPTHQHLAQATWEAIQGRTATIQLKRDNLVFYGSWFDLANGFVGSLVHHQFGLSEIDAFHLLIFLTALVGVAIHAAFTKKLFGQSVAWWSFIFLLFLPRFMAHAHYNPKDIPLATLSVTTLACLFQTWTNKRFKWALAAGFGLGLGLALQLTFLITPLIFAVSLTLTALLKPLALTKKDLILASLSLIIAAGLLWLAWPATWFDPLLPLKALGFFLHHDWQGIVLYLGRLFPAAQVPWHYPLVYLATTTPLVTLILFFVGISQSARRLRRRYSLLPIILILTWLIVPLAIAAKPGTLRYDGLRHFLVVVFPLSTLAGIGADWLVRRLVRRLRQFSAGTVRVGFHILVVGILVKETALVFPYGDVYFNELFRLFVPSRIEEQMDFDYWGLSHREGVTWLNQHAVPDSMVCVPLADHLVWLYPLRSDLTLGCSVDSNYLMFITRKAFLPQGLLEQFALTQPQFTVNRLNSDLLRIYRL